MTLYGPDGAVVRSSDRAIRAERQESQEEEIRAKLKSIDSLLDIRYIEWAGRYALVCQWPQSDTRWKMYQSGEIGEPIDSLGWYCEDMQDPSSLPVSIDSIENLVMERLASCDNTVSNWKDRMRGIIEKNARRRKDSKQEYIDRAEDIASTLRHAVGHLDDHAVERIMDEISQGAN